MDEVYTRKRSYDRERSQNYYRPLYRQLHTDAWYEAQLSDAENTKPCSSCGLVKHVGEYCRNRPSASGWRHECKACQTRAQRGKPTGVSESTKWTVWERDDFRCLGCGTRRYLSVDHIVPRAKGGTDDLGNLQTLCRWCNCAKQHLG